VVFRSAPVVFRGARYILGSTGLDIYDMQRENIAATDGYMQAMQRPERMCA